MLIETQTKKGKPQYRARLQQSDLRRGIKIGKRIVQKLDGDLITLKCPCGNLQTLKTKSFIRAMRDFNYGVCSTCAGRMSASNKLHGFRSDKAKRHPAYVTWVWLREICNNPKNKDYIGVPFDKRWERFADFAMWAKHFWKEGARIRIKDKSQPIGPLNVYWIYTQPVKEVFFQGEQRDIEELYKETKRPVSLKEVKRRIRRGWIVERALTAAPDPTRTQFMPGYYKTRPIDLPQNNQ